MSEDFPGASPWNGESVRARTRALLDAVEPLIEPASRAEVTRFRTDLDAPLRAALVGRVNAGKSTMVNALIGQRVARTDATECTRLTTLYREGRPARTTVEGRDGTTTSIPLSEVLPLDLGRPTHEIDHLVVHLPSRVLGELELIDTPGLAGLGSENELRTTSLLHSSHTAPGVADVILFLFESAPRADEIDSLTALGATRANTLGLLSHADNFGSGPFGDTDPIEAAGTFATRLTERFAESFATVIPVSGLLAEAATTGGFRERDARELVQLAELDEFDLLDALGGDDANSQLRNITDRIGAYGVLHARGIAAQGAQAVNRWMAAQSGIAAVRDLVQRRFSRRSVLERSRQTLAALRAIGQSTRVDAVRALVESAEMDPALHGIREIDALERLLRWDTQHPLVAELERLISAVDSADALAAAATEDNLRLADIAIDRCNEIHARRLTAFSAAEQEALTVIERSFQLIAAGLGG